MSKQFAGTAAADSATGDCSSKKKKRKRKNSESERNTLGSNVFEEIQKDGKHAKCDDKIEFEEPTEPEPTWNLTKDRLVKIRKFRGETYIDIREYYVDKMSWEFKPGQKGISLNLEQYKKLKTLLPKLDAAFPAKREGFVDLLA